MKKVYSSRYLLQRIAREYISRHMGALIFALVCMILTAAATAGNAWLMQPMLDKVFVERDSRMITLIPLAVLMLAFIKGSAGYGQAVVMRNIGQRVVCDMQLKLYLHLLQADLSLFHDQGTGKLISRFTNDIQLMRTSVAAIFTGVAREFLTLIFLIGVMFYQSITLSLIAFAAFPLAILPVIRLAKRMRKISDKTQNELGNFTAWLDETFQGIRIIKAYGREDFEGRRARRVINALYELFAKGSRVQAASSPLMETLSGLAIAGVVWYGGMNVITGATTAGSFFSFVTAMIMAYKPAKTLANLSTNLQEGLAAAERLFTMIDASPVIRQDKHAVDLQLTKGDIRFENIDFSYNQEKQVLKNLSFHVPPGSRVAFVGSSGGGKSTIFNLLLRFYDYDSGSISIDRQDIKMLSLKSLRRSMAIVTQETILFDDTVEANIAYGLGRATREEVIHAATLAGAHDFIQNLPLGYKTMIGQHGVRLSGGQRQRIAIARAFLKDAPILLLDEATSALDPTTERQIQASLETLMQGKTCLFIAHRLATVINADLIYVVQNGSIAEYGTHTELLKKNGIYATLYKREAKS